MVESDISTGMRVSGVIRLKLRFVDLDCGLIRVVGVTCSGDTDEPKSESSQRVLSFDALLGDYRYWKPDIAGLDD